MQVYRLSSLDELLPYAEEWDRLAGDLPFRGWSWLSTWWRHYGEESSADAGGPKLCVLCVFDQADTLVGVAPWYVAGSATHGRVVRPLGSGEVCSEYLGVLCRPGLQCQVTEALADYLTGQSDPHDLELLDWDLLQLVDVDAQDVAVGQLVRCLADRGTTIRTRQGAACWRIPLPDTWEAYLQMLSKSHRKQLRRLQRRIFSTGRAELHSVGRIDELPRAFDMLIDLHQRRRHALGESGSFASARFAAFHREVASALLRAGCLQLHWLEVDGQTAAVEYHLAAGGVVYAYQSGIDPDLLDRQPGRLITMATIRWAIEQGYHALDLLRGDEPYKAHWRAEPRATLSIEVVADRTTARVRDNLCLAGHSVKHWIKSLAAGGS